MKTDLTIWTIKKYLKFYSVCLLLLLLTPLFTQSKNLTIESLASKCPYLDGQAVFKARTLYAMIAGPLTYNDLAICNNLGVYKGGINWYELENAQIGRSNKISDIAIQVFPNPTNGEIYFTSKDVALSGAVVEFYDVLGRKVKSLALLKNLNKISYSLHELPMGIYQYQLKLSNGMQYTGKVVKE
jgi:hypothetical protein